MNDKAKLEEAEYVLWVRSDGGWHGEAKASVQECVLHDKYTSDWFITRRCRWLATERQETLTEATERALGRLNEIPS